MIEDPKEARRREILAAALEAFAEKGYDKTSMDDIVRASGLSKGTLYWYFESKQALFAALVEMMFDEFDAMFQQAAETSQSLTPAERLYAMSYGVGEAFLAEEKLVGLYMDFFVQAWQYEAVQAALTDVYNRYLDLTAGIIREGIDSGAFRPVDARTAARAIAGAVDGLLFQMFVTADEGFQAPLDLLTDIIMRGLAKGEGNA